MEKSPQQLSRENLGTAYNDPDGGRWLRGVKVSAGDAVRSDQTRAQNAAYAAQVSRQAIGGSAPIQTNAIGGSAPIQTNAIGQPAAPTSQAPARTTQAINPANVPGLYEDYRLLLSSGIPQENLNKIVNAGNYQLIQARAKTIREQQGKDMLSEEAVRASQALEAAKKSYVEATDPEAVIATLYGELEEPLIKVYARLKGDPRMEAQQGKQIGVDPTTNQPIYAPGRPAIQSWQDLAELPANDPLMAVVNPIIQPVKKKISTAASLAQAEWEKANARYSAVEAKRIAAGAGPEPTNAMGAGIDADSVYLRKLQAQGRQSETGTQAGDLALEAQRDAAYARENRPIATQLAEQAAVSGPIQYGNAIIGGGDNLIGWLPKGYTSYVKPDGSYAVITPDNRTLSFVNEEAARTRLTAPTAPEVQQPSNTIFTDTFKEVAGNVVSGVKNQASAIYSGIMDAAKSLPRPAPVPMNTQPTTQAEAPAVAAPAPKKFSRNPISSASPKLMPYGDPNNPISSASPKLMPYGDPNNPILSGP